MHSRRRFQWARRPAGGRGRPRRPWRPRQPLARGRPRQPLARGRPRQPPARGSTKREDRDGGSRAAFRRLARRREDKDSLTVGSRTALRRLARRGEDKDSPEFLIFPHSSTPPRRLRRAAAACEVRGRVVDPGGAAGRENTPIITGRGSRELRGKRTVSRPAARPPERQPRLADLAREDKPGSPSGRAGWSPVPERVGTWRIHLRL